MKTILVCASVVLLALGTGVSHTQNTRTIIADFNKPENVTDLGDAFGSWDKDPNDKTQGCRMSFVRDDALMADQGLAVRLNYDVDSPNPAYNGFWMKLDSAKSSGYDALSFYLKGDLAAGFTKKIKVEIKDKMGGKETTVIDSITDRWQMFSVPLKASGKPLSEFTIVFDDVNSQPKSGAILIDRVEFIHHLSN